jgi:hypothetical protein
MYYPSCFYHPNRCFEIIRGDIAEFLGTFLIGYIFQTVPGEELPSGYPISTKPAIPVP